MNLKKLLLNRKGIWFLLTFTAFLLFAYLFFLIVRTNVNNLLESKNTLYEQEVTTEGNRRIFRKGLVERLPDHPPRLELSGTHYEMGLQYGVLLNPEIQRMKEGGRKMLAIAIDDIGLPEWVTLLVLKYKVNALYRRLPQRFRDEMRGIAEGSGLKFETIKLFACFSEVAEFEEYYADNCASLVVKNPDNTMIHAWNNDESNGQFLSAYTTIVYYKPKGYHSFIDIKPVFVLGTSAAHHPNEKALSISDNSLVTPGSKKGIHPDYYNRMIMEECSSLKDVRTFLDNHVRLIPSAIIITDRSQGKAVSFEMAVDNEKMIWREVTRDEKVFWATNKCQDQEISRKYEDIFVSKSPYNNSRQKMLEEFALHETDSLSLDKVIKLMRSTEVPGVDSTRAALEEAICNAWTVKMVVHADGGAYLARNKGCFGALGTVYFYPDDINAEPQLKYEALELSPMLREFGEIVSSIHSQAEFNAAYAAIANKYPQEPFILFHAAKESAGETRTRLFQKAYSLNSTNYQIAIEKAALMMTNNLDRAIIILDKIDAPSIESNDLYYAGYRLALLAEAYKRKGEKSKSQEYLNKLKGLGIKQKHIDNLLDFVKNL